MRYASIVGVQDNVRFTVYGYSLVADIAEIGQCVEDLTYRAELSGTQLLDLLKCDTEKEYGVTIVPDNSYVVTARDW